MFAGKKIRPAAVKPVVEGTEREVEDIIGCILFECVSSVFQGAMAFGDGDRIAHFVPPALARDRSLLCPLLSVAKKVAITFHCYTSSRVDASAHVGK